MTEDHIFTLTEAERERTRAVATALTAVESGLVDDRAWLDACRGMSEQLPERLRRRLRDFRHDPDLDGMLLVRNLPVAPALAPTPTVPESVERRATPAAGTTALVSMQIGEVIAYRDEKSGALVQNVVPVAGREEQQSNAGSVPLELHVENAFHPHRPDMVALFCVRPDHEGGAGLRVASVRRAVEMLPHDIRKVLGEDRFRTEVPPSFGGPDGPAPQHPILSGDFDDPDVRVDFHATHPEDEQAAEAMAVLRAVLDTITRAVHLRPGDLAIVDNRVALHGRTHFVPRYDGEDRWLHRTFIHLDHRRSRAVRSGNGQVLS
ncbi:TauD/TfdA family dioxygenase [Streptomyces sp. VRA16 Mangrove soil]|uniref:TauD/TfdA family dioxygenase n=1 Tax=Streptomyces sp. VRA16 Mangrove soil TaxID=2817434 RepID=UPI001A9E4545|nr:TauD/TfdA family dioxygenase [Streptomyces sp. VRA16 Mangrove soil]MBO1334089.1 TauD/TfdA family dioxygenase [Streptomyces sp. VRA16 Mangrove soil]